ncbi:MAG: HAD family hydrolase [Bacteroidetes bacterium]|nr:HAD family hydrolase [Bacteroidota bacterium]
MLDLKLVDHQWTIFLDRDGVINFEKENDYVLNKNEFVFYPGAAEAIGIFSKLFMYIIIVTNQRGIGKGLMTEDDLVDIHSYMLASIREAGGRIDKIYHCSSLMDNDPMRKPNPGMALSAKKDFPKIDFSKSIMVGNRVSDMEFGRNAGMHTVFLATTHPDVKLPHPAIDLSFNNLASFAKALHLK